MRAYAREVAFCQIYQNLINQTDDCDIDLDFFDASKIQKKDEQFVNTIVGFAKMNMESQQQEIALLSRGFRLDRIFRIDLALLHLAMSELACFDTPKAVVINEVVELAKRFSAPKSVSFINGILASYVKENT